jgi:hypothetical protein
MSECDEVADTLLPSVPDGASIGEVRYIVAKAIPGESVTITDNVTYSIMRGLRARAIRQKQESPL